MKIFKILSRSICRVSPGILLVFWSACEPEPLVIEDIPQLQPRLVVSGRIIPDQFAVIWLTRTFDALQADDDSDPEDLINLIAVNDAEVTLSDSQNSYPLFNLDFGLYGGAFIPLQPGKTFQLNVESPTLGTVSATSTVKKQVVLDSLEALTYINDFDDTLMQVNYTFTDPVGKNWYMINVQRFKNFRSLDELDLLNPEIFTKLIDDAEFDGQQHQGKFTIYSEEFAVGDSLLISLSNISEIHYHFMEQQSDNQLELTEFLSEPADFPSNVENGFGIFDLFLSDSRLVISTLK